MICTILTYLGKNLSKEYNSLFTVYTSYDIIMFKCYSHDIVSCNFRRLTNSLCKIQNIMQKDIKNFHVLPRYYWKYNIK